MLQAAQLNNGARPEVGLADVGYLSGAVLQRLSTSATEGIVALGREDKKRMAIVEPPNAWIKQVPGCRQFSFRGVDKVRREFKLVRSRAAPRRAALHLRRMATMTA